MIKIITAIFCLSLTTEARELSLEDAVVMAKNQSWDIKKEGLNFEKVILQRKQVIGSVLPQISASATYNNYIKKPVIQGFSLNSKHELDMGLTLRQRVFEFGGIGNSLDAASALLQESQFRKDQMLKYVAHEATIAYYSVLLSKNQLEIAQQSYNNARKNLQILNQSFSSGRAPRGDILRLETDIVSRESQVNIAKANLVSAEIMLKEILKIPEDEKISLSTPLKKSLPELDRDDVTKKTISENLDLKVLGQRVQYLNKAADVQKSDYLPKLGFFYNISRSGRSEDQVFGSDQKVNTQIVGLELTWNLWDGGQSRTRYQEAKNDALIANYEVKSKSDDLLKDLATAVNNYMTIRSNLATDEKSLDLAQKSFTLTQDLLRTGKTSITELNSTEGVLNSIKSNYALNLFRANESLSLIHYLMNSEEL